MLCNVRFALLQVLLQLQIHDAWAFLHAESHWDRHPSACGPLGALWDGVTALWKSPGNDSESHDPFTNIENLVYTLAFIAVLPFAWKCVGKPYAVYAALALAIPMSAPSTPTSSSGNPRPISALLDVTVRDACIPLVHRVRAFCQAHRRQPSDHHGQHRTPRPRDSAKDVRQPALSMLRETDGLGVRSRRG